ncbi:hypothetical protein AS031_12655 [Pseudarthrobacter enclensis]|uniref:Uncharacterized protein n=1 Tax=Pseudarthrobacter enclensis TaxID=993070 RepID=A0A0V8IKX2_9MICC|nr:hypothetical protein AS031_12655 [Pseudarthrobacter enclensis]
MSVEVVHPMCFDLPVKIIRCSSTISGDTKFALQSHAVTIGALAHIPGSIWSQPVRLDPVLGMNQSQLIKEDVPGSCIISTQANLRQFPSTLIELLEI